MASTVFDLQININSQPAESALKRLQSQFDSTKKKADAIGTGATTGLKNYTTTVKAATNVTELFSKAIGLIAFGKIATETVKAISQIESLQANLKILTGNAEEASKALTLIQNAASGTAFTVNDVGAAFINLSANGIKPTVEQLKLFQDVASAATDKVGALNAISNLFARNVEGGLNLQDLNTLASQGIPVLTILRQKLGITRDAIAELGKTSAGANIILKALQDGLGAKFAGNASEQVKTLSGSFAVLEKSLTSIAQVIGESGLSDGLKEVAKTLNDTVGASGGAAQTIGSVLGTALKGLATVIKFVSDYWKELLFVVGAALLPFTGVGAAILTVIRAIIAFPAAIGAFITGFRVLITSVGALTEGLGFFRAAWIVVTETLANIPVVAPILKFFAEFNTLLGNLLGGWIRNSAYAVAFLAVIEKIKGIFKSDEKPAFTGGASGSWGPTPEEEAAAKKQTEEAQKLNDLLSGKKKIITDILTTLSREGAAIGKNKAEAEAQTEVLKAQADIRQKLASSLTKGSGPGVSSNETEAEFQKRLDKDSILSAQEAGRIRGAVFAKYGAQLKQVLKDQQFELSLIGASANEAEKLRAIREIELEYGKKGLGIDKERAAVISGIAQIQDAKINSSLKESIADIRNETDLLKLGNAERERAVALDGIASNAGFKNRADLLLNATPEQRKNFDAAGAAVNARAQETINAQGREQISNLKDQLALLSIVDEKERERATTLADIYKQIDPNGKGANITDAQKEQIKLLEAQIEAQNALIAVNKQIQDSFTSLGDAVTKYFLKGADAVRNLKLELIKLAALEAFKYFAGGQSSGAAGSFFSGLISGLRAEGGSTQPGKIYRVGEKGPENVMFGAGATVIPNSAAQMQISSKTGGITIQVNPVFSNHGTVNSTEDLEGYMQKWGDGIVTGVVKHVEDQFRSTGLAYNR